MRPPFLFSPGRWTSWHQHCMMGSVGSCVLCQVISRFISISSLLLVPRLSEHRTKQTGDKQVLSSKTNMSTYIKHWGQMADALNYDPLWLHFRPAAFSDNPTYCIRVRVPQQTATIYSRKVRFKACERVVAPNVVNDCADWANAAEMWSETTPCSKARSSIPHRYEPSVITREPSWSITSKWWPPDLHLASGLLYIYCCYNTKNILLKPRWR